MYIILYLSYLHYIMGFKIGIDSIGHSSDKKVSLKKAQKLFMHGRGKGFPFIEMTSQTIDCLNAETVGNEKLLKIYRIHLMYLYTSERY